MISQQSCSVWFTSFRLHRPRQPHIHQGFAYIHDIATPQSNLLGLKRNDCDIAMSPVMLNVIIVGFLFVVAIFDWLMGGVVYSNRVARSCCKATQRTCPTLAARMHSRSSSNFITTHTIQIIRSSTHQCRFDEEREPQSYRDAKKATSLGSQRTFHKAPVFR